MKAGKRKRIIFVCTGNTCRSPMAKVITEQKLQAAGVLDKFNVESAACSSAAAGAASKNAREAIKSLFGQDLLSEHQAKPLSRALIEQADLIFVMQDWMKKGLPPGKTHTLKEYAGSAGDIGDPFGGNLETYLDCAREISAAVDILVKRLADG